LGRVRSSAIPDSEAHGSGLRGEIGWLRQVHQSENGHQRPEEEALSGDVAASEDELDPAVFRTMFASVVRLERPKLGVARQGYTGRVHVVLNKKAHHRNRTRGGEFPVRAELRGADRHVVDVTLDHDPVFVASNQVGH